MALNRILIKFGLLIIVLLAACTDQNHPAISAADWQRYQEAFISAEGRVIDTGNKDISHSEGQGYAMLLALAADDRNTFERIWQWSKQNLQREDHLFGWRWEPNASPPVTDWNNASDGDLLIAWALAEGGAQWEEKEWSEQAKTIAKTIRQTLIRDSGIGPLLIPGQVGFEHDGRLTLNPSYWIFPAFDALDQIDPHPVWQDLTRSGLRLLALTRYGLGVPPDWVVLHPQGHLSLPEDPAKRRLGFESIRVPLYLCWGGHHDEPMLQAFQQLWPSDDAPAWIDLHQGDRAAFSLTLSQRAMRQLVRVCAGQQNSVPAMIETDEYYGSTLSLLSRIAITQAKRR